MVVADVDEWAGKGWVKKGKMKKFIQNINSLIARILLKYGVLILLFSLALSIWYVHTYYHESWMQASGVIIAIVALFITVLINAMNNKASQENTDKQIQAFKEQIDSQIKAFETQTNAIVEGLEKVYEAQQIQSNIFINQTNRLSQDLNKVHDASKANTETLVSTMDYNEPVSNVLIKGIVLGIGDKIVKGFKFLTNLFD